VERNAYERSLLIDSTYFSAFKRSELLFSALDRIGSRTVRRITSRVLLAARAACHAWPFDRERQGCFSHGSDEGGGCSDGNAADAARRLRATLFRRSESARNDNGDGVATQPLSDQPTIRPATPVAIPGCIPTALAIIERGDACIATRPTNWWGCLLVELLGSVKKHPSLALPFGPPLSLPRSVGWQTAG